MKVTRISLEKFAGIGSTFNGAVFGPADVQSQTETIIGASEKAVGVLTAAYFGQIIFHVCLALYPVHVPDLTVHARQRTGRGLSTMPKTTSSSANINGVLCKGNGHGTLRRFC